MAPPEARPLRHGAGAVRRRRSIALGTPLAVLVVWELAVRLGDISPIFLVPPSVAVAETYKLIVSGVLWPHLVASAQTFGIGFGLSVVLGIFFGLVTGWYRRIFAGLDFVFTLMYSTPTIVLLPLIILWIGVGRPAQVTVIFLAAFFPIVFTVSAGVRSIDRQLIRVARAYGAGDWILFRDVAVPSSLTHTLSGIRIAFGRAIVALIFAEWFTGSTGVGFLIAFYGQRFDTARLLAVLLVVMGFSVLATLGLRSLENAYLSRVGAGGVTD